MARPSTLVIMSPSSSSAAASLDDDVVVGRERQDRGSDGGGGGGTNVWVRHSLLAAAVSGSRRRPSYTNGGGVSRAARRRNAANAAAAAAASAGNHHHHHKDKDSDDGTASTATCSTFGGGGGGGGYGYGYGPTPSAEWGWVKASLLSCAPSPSKRAGNEEGAASASAAEVRVTDRESEYDGMVVTIPPHLLGGGGGEGTKGKKKTSSSRKNDEGGGADNNGSNLGGGGDGSLAGSGGGIVAANAWADFSSVPSSSSSSSTSPTSSSSSSPSRVPTPVNRPRRLQNGDDNGSSNRSLSNSVPLSSPPSDLIHLTHLHEPAVVHCLRHRYALDEIYTATGPILLALNPFKDLRRTVYGESTVRRYRERGEDLSSSGGNGGSGGGARSGAAKAEAQRKVAETRRSNGGGSSPSPGMKRLLRQEEKNAETASAAAGAGELPPHVYAVADAAYRSMMRSLEDARGGSTKKKKKKKKKTRDAVIETEKKKKDEEGAAYADDDATSDEAAPPAGMVVLWDDGRGGNDIPRDGGSRGSRSLSRGGGGGHVRQLSSTFGAAAAASSSASSSGDAVTAVVPRVRTDRSPSPWQRRTTTDRSPSPWQRRPSGGGTPPPPPTQASSPLPPRRQRSEDREEDPEEKEDPEEETGNQSILVSGESGAGKTVTTKFIMRYLAALSEERTGREEERRDRREREESHRYLPATSPTASSVKENDMGWGGGGNRHHKREPSSSHSAASSSEATTMPLGGAHFGVPVPAPARSSLARSPARSDRRHNGAGRYLPSSAASVSTASVSSPWQPPQHHRWRQEDSSGSTAATVANHGNGNNGYHPTPEPNKSSSFSIEDQVLQSNPILESFGNARTLRNDNSSRFGKFIEIRFSSGEGYNDSDVDGGSARAAPPPPPMGSLAGASIETYLLEKVRVVHRSDGERNYHVFYELLSAGAGSDNNVAGKGKNKGGGLSREERRLLELDGLTPEHFVLTRSPSGTYGRRDGVTDASTYLELRNAMTAVGFTDEERTDVFEIASGLMHLGNATFEEVRSGGSGIDGHDRVVLDRSEEGSSRSSLGSACRLLGVNVDDLEAGLTTAVIEAGGGGSSSVAGGGGGGRRGSQERVRTYLDGPRSKKALEALLKGTYGALFEYLVERVNKCIKGGGGGGRSSEEDGSAEAHAREEEGDTSSGASDAALVEEGGGGAFIGVLDIFGFESFESNSFEQLCINYCNESLQQQFNRFVFKLEQAEYEREGIQWRFIEFPDNQDVLDLIDRRHTGILSILDEKCRLGASCTDRTFCNAMYAKCSPSSSRSDSVGKGRSGSSVRGGRLFASPGKNDAGGGGNGNRGGDGGNANVDDNGNNDGGPFLATTTQKARGLFGVRHYAGPVEYDATGFLEKNKDELPKEVGELLGGSTKPLLRLLARKVAPAPSASSSKDDSSMTSSRHRGRKSRSAPFASVGSQFRSQLRSLRKRVDATSPHYVRCLKPNDDLLPDKFDPVVVADQLRCAGILEAVRVSRVGFPQRYLHERFVGRYGCLAVGGGRRDSSGGRIARVRPRGSMTPPALPSRGGREGGGGSVFQRANSFSGGGFGGGQFQGTPPPAVRSGGSSFRSSKVGSGSNAERPPADPSPRDFEKECKVLVGIIARKIWAAKNGGGGSSHVGGVRGDERDGGNASGGVDKKAENGREGSRWGGRSPSSLALVPAEPAARSSTPSKKYATNSGPPPWASRLRKTGGQQSPAPSRPPPVATPSPPGLLPPPSPSRAVFTNRVTPPSGASVGGGTGGNKGNNGLGAKPSTPRSSSSKVDLIEVGIQMGKTKVFLRQRAFDAMERLRNEVRSSAATVLNAIFRTYLCRIAYVPVRDAYREEQKRKEQMVKEAKKRLNAAATSSNGCESQSSQSGSTRPGAQPPLSSSSRYRSSNTSALIQSFESNSAGGGKEFRPRGGPEEPQKPSKKVFNFKWLLVDGKWVRNYAAEQQAEEEAAKKKQRRMMLVK